MAIHAYVFVFKYSVYWLKILRTRIKSLKYKKKNKKKIDITIIQTYYKVKFNISSCKSTDI